MSLTPSWRPITRRTLDLFGRWGDPRTNLRSMLSGIIPVAVVDDFKDDDRGSIFGINAFSAGTANEFPAVSFGSTVNDWELLAITSLWVDWRGLVAGGKDFEFHMFTPINPYNPVATASPVGFFPTGLLTNRAFTFGTVVGLGGTNPAPPVLLGPALQWHELSSDSRILNVFRFAAFPHFDPPIRIYRNVTLTIQFIGTIGVVIPTQMVCSILYRERPKVSL